MPVEPWLLTMPVAHRGLHGAELPENSLAAFQAAARRGYAIEFDVRLAGGDAAVVFHDANLKRMTGAAGELAATGAAALAKLRLKGTAERVPTLAEVLSAIDGVVPLLIELKTPPDRPRGTLETAVWRVLAGYRGSYAVQSFAPETVAWLRREAPGVMRGQLVDSGFDRRLVLLPWTRPHFIGCNVKGLPAHRLARTGLPVLAWTVRSLADRLRAHMFADNVIFEGYRA